MKKSLIIALLALVSCAGKQEASWYHTLCNDAGMKVDITPYGGRIVSLWVPDRDGELRDVVLGFDRLEDYYPENNQTDFGASIGRYANRIGGGRFTLDGTEYQLPLNNYGHCLHGGPSGWQYKNFKVDEADASHIVLSLDSPDGDNNFPGNVHAVVTYRLTADNRLEISYEATTDKPTVINMTNHAYFNLAGRPESHSIEDDVMYVNSSAFTPVDSTFMTTGEIRPVEGTPFDFREPARIGDRINLPCLQLRNGHGFDHNWVLDTKGSMESPAAKVICPESGITLTVYTDEPGIQIYCGNFLDGTVTGKRGVVYNYRRAICLESQHYPDSPNKPDWPSPVLRPGETYTSHCTFAFGTVSE